MAKNYWLMKTEPEVFSFDDLVRERGRTTCWEGVRNYQARNLMRDTFKKGDQALIYHSNIADPGVFGVAEVVKEGYPDKYAFEQGNKYFDAKAFEKGINPWILVDVRATHRLENPVTRSAMKEMAALKNMMVLKRGARLSVQPVTAAEFKAICQRGKLKKI